MFEQVYFVKNSQLVQPNGGNTMGAIGMESPWVWKKFDLKAGQIMNGFIYFNYLI